MIYLGNRGWVTANRGEQKMDKNQFIGALSDLCTRVKHIQEKSFEGKAAVYDDVPVQPELEYC